MVDKDAELGELISAVRYLSTVLSEKNAHYLSETIGRAVKYGESLAKEES